MGLRYFLNGEDCINKNKTLEATLEANSELKLYISKLCGSKSRYLFPRDRSIPQDQLINERMAFVYSLVGYYVVCSVCCFRYAVEMTAFEVFEVKQAMEDVIEFLMAAEKAFSQSIDEDKITLERIPIRLSKNYLQTLSGLHVQKSADPNVDTNSQLYSCYKRLDLESAAQLQLLKWTRDADALQPLSNFLVAEIQKRLLNSQMISTTQSNLGGHLANGDNSRIFDRVQPPVQTQSIISPDPPKNLYNPSVELKEDRDLSHSLRTKADTVQLPQEVDPKKFSDILEDKKSNQGSIRDIEVEIEKKEPQIGDKKQPSASKKESSKGLCKKPLAEAKLSDSLGPAPVPIAKKKKSRKHSHTFAPIE